MVTLKLVTEIFGSIDVKLMKLQRQSRRGSEEFTKGKESRNAAEFYIRRISISLNLIFIETETTPSINCNDFQQSFMTFTGIYIITSLYILLKLNYN